MFRIFKKENSSLNLVLVLILSGCASIVGVQGLHTYEGEKKPDAQLATIVQTEDPNIQGNGYFIGVDGVEYGGYFAGHPRIVKMLPGQHYVTYECVLHPSGMRARIRTRFNFEAGKFYGLFCEEKTFGLATPIVKSYGTTRPI
ncbi:hypothetical protein ACO0LC_15705 [Undibacterium sp. JH2W]|uniref:hypothetical protein n=1 Tax=Undibacterium sp. JH2W TaxID=3413037 RepID=UPI003BF18210